MNRKLTVSAVAATIVGLGVLAGPTATASAASDVPGSHCVAHATGDLQLACYDSFAEALEKASGGRLTHGPKNAAEALDDPAFIARVEAANADANRADAAGGFAAAAGFDTVISIDYMNTNWNAPELIWLGTGNCSTSTNNTDYEISTMPAGWVNVVSSYRTFANCWVKHYEDPSFNGNVEGYNGSRASMTAGVDNRTSSERWS